ncbi:MAG: GGDEF domain-containing protein [Deltaproteobacteria bacterium]|nr:GGDEF domain-containing protein [Deltaproteobacteria bacterium]
MSEKEKTEQTIVTSVDKLQAPGEKSAYILFLSGPLVGKLHPLKTGETVFGRDPQADITINDNRISRKHLSITVTPGGTTLADLGSTNGTFVNGKKIRTHLLKDGDKIQISSNTIFKFAYQDNIENIYHKELYKMAVIDPVCGIFNKRYFLDRFNEEFNHAKRSGAPLSLLMMDLDHFKKINDTHGHLAGDFCLAHIAETIKKIVRLSDIFARYGGEEFVLLLRETDEKGAWQMGERIRKLAEKNPANFEATPVPITVSVGLSTLQEGDEFLSPEAMLEKADHYLYQSKKNGRNKTSSKNFS